MTSIQALILAGGFGTRLRSLINDRPKPLAPIGSMPFLEHQLRFLMAYDVREFVFCVGYRHEQVEEHFEDGSDWGVSIRYSVESEPRGTAGALKLAAGLVQGTFLALNGDTFFDLDIRKLIAAHRQARGVDPRCLGTLALTEVEDPTSFGSVTLDEQGMVTGFQEKTARRQPPHYISAGVYVLEPRVLDAIPADQNVSLERDTFPRVLEDDRLHGHRTRGYFVDIGTPEGYRRFQDYAGGVLS